MRLPLFYFTHGVASSTYTQPTTFHFFFFFFFSFLLLLTIVSVFLKFFFFLLWIFLQGKKIGIVCVFKICASGYVEGKAAKPQNGSRISFFFFLIFFKQTQTLIRHSLTQSLSTSTPFLSLSQPKNFVLEAVPTDQIYTYKYIYISWQISQSCNIPSLFYLRIIQTTTITYKLYHSIFLIQYNVLENNFTL